MNLCKNFGKLVKVDLETLNTLGKEEIESIFFCKYSNCEHGYNIPVTFRNVTYNSCITKGKVDENCFFQFYRKRLREESSNINSIL